MCFGFFSAALLLPGQQFVSARRVLVREVMGCRVQCHRPQRDQVLHGERMSMERLLGRHAGFGGGRPLAVTSFALNSHHPLGKETWWQSEDKHRPLWCPMVPAFARFWFLSVPWLSSGGFGPINFFFFFFFLTISLLHFKILFYSNVKNTKHSSSSYSNKIGTLITLTWSMY